ncbi:MULTISPECIES: hypothetical protein [unclassified Thiocapsa]|uniref:hypothetical protein n=1 Tax=unclassified Thiocapsa TaxID=2641286 RepID=UPI0035B270F8
MPENYVEFGAIVREDQNPPLQRPPVDPMLRIRWQREMPRRARNAIMNHWLQSGGPASAVGLPLDPSFPVLNMAGDKMRSDFRGGRLTFNDHDGTVVESELHKVVVTFEGYGLEIRQEDGDEIFGSIHSTIGTSGYTKDIVLPEVVLGPEGNNRIQQYGMVLYEGPPVDLGIVLSLTEHDSGDRKAVRDEVRVRVNQIFQEARNAAAAGAAGSAAQQAATAMTNESLVSSSLQNWIINGAADLINDLLGMGDDPYNPVGFTITANQMQNIPPMLQYRCSSDPRVINFTQGLSRMMTGRDDAGDVGQITALFSIRPA